MHNKLTQWQCTLSKTSHITSCLQCVFSHRIFYSILTMASLCRIKHIAKHLLTLLIEYHQDHQDSSDLRCGALPYTRVIALEAVVVFFPAHTTRWCATSTVVGKARNGVPPNEWPRRYSSHHSSKREFDYQCDHGETPQASSAPSLPPSLPT